MRRRGGGISAGDVGGFAIDRALARALERYPAYRDSGGADWRGPDGYNVGVNVGEAAGQTVMHLHVHLIPRYAGDVEDPRGGVRGAIPEKRAY